MSDDVAPSPPAARDGVERDAARGRRPRARARSRAPTRSPQVCSWSAAAARNVSAAPSTTLRPSATSTRASLPHGRRLAGAVDADDEDDGRTVVARAASCAACGRRRVDARDAAPRAAAARASLGRPDALDPDALAQPVDELGRRRDARGRTAAASPRSRPRCPRRGVAREQGEQPAARACVCERESRARRRDSRPAVGSGTSSWGSTGSTETVSAPSRSSGRPTTSTVRVGVSRGTSASSPVPGR